MSSDTRPGTAVPGTTMLVSRSDGLFRLVDLLSDKAPEWQERALCRETDPEAFFPEKGKTGTAAKAICRRCEVRDECLEYALRWNELADYGVWGETSKKERKRIRARRREKATPGTAA